MGFVANFLANTTVKEFRTSTSICQSYERMYSGTVFFDSLCICLKSTIYDGV